MGEKEWGIGWKGKRMKERKGEGGQTGVNLLTLFWFSLSRLYSICCGIQTHPLLFYTGFHLNFRLWMLCAFLRHCWVRLLWFRRGSIQYREHSDQVDLGFWVTTTTLFSLSHWPLVESTWSCIVSLNKLHFFQRCFQYCTCMKLEDLQVTLKKKSQTQSNGSHKYAILFILSGVQAPQKHWILHYP